MATVRSIGLGAGLVAGLLAAGCGGDAERDGRGRVAEAGQLSVFELAEGDCFDGGATGEELGDVDALPCDEAHEHEVFALLTHPDPAGAPFPGRERIIAFAERRCVERFAEYVGAAYGVSDLEIALIPPEERSWTEKDDRTIACVLHDAEGQRLTGSKKA